MLCAMRELCVLCITTKWSDDSTMEGGLPYLYRPNAQLSVVGPILEEVSGKEQAGVLDLNVHA